MKNLWDHARALAEMGLQVLPLRAGRKEPAIAGGCHAATTKAVQLDRWARRFPTANLGIATGGARDLLVLDFDVAADLSLPAADARLIDMLADLKARVGRLPTTWTARTSRGGMHLYFTAPGAALGNSCRLLADGVDTRGQGGYVVAPPSRLADGRGWRWVRGRSPFDLPLAKAPERLIHALSVRPPARSAETLSTTTTHTPAMVLGHRPDTPQERRIAAYLAKLPALADGEGRNARGYALAAHCLHTWQMSLTDALLVLRQWNAGHTHPLPDATLDTLAQNAARYGGRHAA